MAGTTVELVRQGGQSEWAGRRGQKEHPWASVAAAGRGQPAKTEGMLNARLLCSAALGAGGRRACVSLTHRHTLAHMHACIRSHVHGCILGYVYIRTHADGHPLACELGFASQLASDLWHGRFYRPARRGTPRVKPPRDSSVLPPGSSPRVAPAVGKPFGDAAASKDDVGKFPSLSETERTNHTECAKLPGQQTCYTLEKTPL